MNEYRPGSLGEAMRAPDPPPPPPVDPRREFLLATQQARSILATWGNGFDLDIPHLRDWVKLAQLITEHVAVTCNGLTLADLEE